MIKMIDPLGVGSDELFVGRSGYIMGCIWLERQLGQQVVSILNLNISRIISPRFWMKTKFTSCAMLSLRVVASSPRRCPASVLSCTLTTRLSILELLMDSQVLSNISFLNIINNISGVLLQLLRVPGFIEHNPEAEKDIRESVNWIVSTQSYDGNFPCSMGELKDPRDYDDQLVQWCHSAPGTASLLARSYLLWSDQHYMTGERSIQKIPKYVE